jgi:hypothetical protein
MSRLTRVKSLKSVLALTLLVSAAALAATAAAEPRLDAEYASVSRQLDEAKARVRWLEERLHHLDARREEEAERQRPLDAAERTGNACALPFYLDLQGIRHLRDECRDSASPNPCDTPFTIDEAGIKRVRAACDPEGATP